MAAAKAQGLAWRRRQGAGPSEKAMAQVRSDLADAIKAKHAKEAADLGTVPMPKKPGPGASPAEMVAWAKSVEAINRVRPRTEAEKEFEFQMVGIRHNFEKSGTNWTDPASIGTLMTCNMHLVNELKAAVVRISALEKQAAEQKAVIAHVEKHHVRFAGTFDLANHYGSGAIVRYKGLLYVSVKDIAAGKAFPPREGSGWAPFS
ncbi:hypothetical protein FQZ97_869380 [compost metagenome]